MIGMKSLGLRYISQDTRPARGLEVYMVNIDLELFTFDPQVEEQEWPVTPYQIKVYTQTHCPDSWYYVYVDGVQSEWEVVNGGTEWLALNVHLSYIM